jgi:hypothetical protein
VLYSDRCRPLIFAVFPYEISIERIARTSFWEEHE